MTPEWPAPRYKTREEAIAAAMLVSEPGEHITIHEDRCAMRLEQECDCEPSVVVVQEARA